MENVDKWGVDIFRIADLTANRPLTVITYTLLQVANVDLCAFYFAARRIQCHTCRVLCTARCLSVYHSPVLKNSKFPENQQEAFEKMLGLPIRHCEPPHAACSNFTLPFTRCRYCRTPPLSHAACASMSTTTTTTTTTTTRDRGGPLWLHRMGPIIVRSCNRLVG